jgi:2-dehydro-3-deoxyphosphogluconate aldolase / (4S)-4-hydroxy-2-oxoglutarate aldolase
MFKLQEFEKKPILGIIRGVTKASLKGTLQAALDGGLKFVEITMNTPNASELLKEANREFPHQLVIGAGTVTNLSDLRVAITAGVQFIVCPNLNKDVMQICRQEGVPVFPGALTPTEIASAYQSGATMVKVFPISAMGGVKYLKNIRGPFNEEKLLACGGVNPENLKDYFEAGANAIAIGSQIFNPEWMDNKEFEKIKAAAKKFINLVHEVKSK